MQTWDFVPLIVMENQEIEMVNNMKLLGVTIKSNLSWTPNTELMTKNAYKRLWSLRRLKGMGTTVPDMKDVYTKQVRSVLELAVPAWNGALTQCDSKHIERVQKTAVHIMLGGSYSNYETALEVVGLEPLHARRVKLCLKFARKASKDPKHKNWFKPNIKAQKTRLKKTAYHPVYANHKRFERSPISYLTNLLNSDTGT